MIWDGFSVQISGQDDHLTGVDQAGTETDDQTGLALVGLSRLQPRLDGQAPRGFSGWASVGVQDTGHYTLDPTVGRTNADLGDPAILGDTVISGSASDVM